MAFSMKFNEFIKLRREEQLKLLMDYWHLDIPYIKCRAEIRGEIDEKNIAKLGISNVRHPYSEMPLVNPFNQNSLDKAFRVNVKKNKIARMNSMEIMARFSVMDSIFSYDMIHTEGTFLEIDKQDVFSLIELDEIFKEGNMEDFKSFIRDFFSGRKVVFADELKIKVSSLNDEYEEHVELSRKLDEELHTKKSNISLMEKELNRLLMKKQEHENTFNSLLEKIAKRKSEINELADQVNIFQKEYSYYVKELNMLKKLGFYKEETTASEKPLVEAYQVEDEVSYIQSYLRYKHVKNLSYDYHLINCFYGALKTNQLIMLCGEPGTGKTSLVTGVAEALGAELLVIPVQPDWSSHEDLLGFYNPVDKAYISTPFLDKLLEAEGNPDRLYIICLDEMNLAHVEYYFNDFLSALQSKEPLMLYSENIEQLEKEEIGSYLFGLNEVVDDSDINDWFNNSDNKSKDLYLTLKRRWNMFSKYKAKLTIPSNVRFVGTINIDETTKDISPKVVDRSFMIKVRKPEEAAAPKDFHEYRVLNVNAGRMKPREDNVSISADLLRDICAVINSLNDIKDGFSENFNYRFDTQIKELSVIFDGDRLFDYILFGKILPKVKFIIESEYREQVMESINTIYSVMEKYECKLSGTIFDRMEKRFESETEQRLSGELNYWS